MKMSTIMLSLLALVGCIFSIGVLLGALALNGDDTGKHSYRSKTYKNEDVYQDGPDPALGIGRTIPTLPGAQEHGVQPPTVATGPRSMWKLRRKQKPTCLQRQSWRQNALGGTAYAVWRASA